ncbi:MAG: NADH-quinone oxidoreductase subunit, partial [Pseudomonadota bacterium]|nr:NADH-quinone oxidoreductase subunit [Pseudomonadota bacterium]
MNALPSLPGLPALPILSILLALPLLGAATCFLLRDERIVRAVAIATATLALAAALAALLLFDGQNGGFQLQEKHLWIPGLNVHYFVGIDGLSVLFLPATTLLFLCGIVTTGRGVKPLPNLHFALILLFETATLGIFCALDTLLLFFFWELTLLPLYFLIGLWGLGAHGRAAATRYFLVMLVGGVPLLFAFIALAANAGWAFD